jgi:hypothetical protein
MARARFTQADVTRAAKGAVAAGLRVVRLEIDQTGKLAVFTSAESENNADAALAEWERTHGTG